MLGKVLIITGAFAAGAALVIFTYSWKAARAEGN